MYQKSHFYNTSLKISILSLTEFITNFMLFLPWIPWYRDGQWQMSRWKWRNCDEEWGIWQEKQRRLQADEQKAAKWSCCERTADGSRLTPGDRRHCRCDRGWTKRELRETDGEPARMRELEDGKEEEEEGYFDRTEIITWQNKTALPVADRRLQKKMKINEQLVGRTMEDGSSSKTRERKWGSEPGDREGDRSGGSLGWETIYHVGLPRGESKEREVSRAEEVLGCNVKNRENASTGLEKKKKVTAAR